MTMEDYAACYQMLLQRVLQPQRPAQELLNDYFLRGLAKNLQTILATVDKVATHLADVIT